MSSISAQGVVERASAELSKRINGLGLRSKHHHGSSSSSSSGSSGGKTSVMERVTNALCGGSNSNSNAAAAAAAAAAANNQPDKPSRVPANTQQQQQQSASPAGGTPHQNMTSITGNITSNMSGGIKQQQQQGITINSNAMNTGGQKSQTGTPQQVRKQLPNPHLHHHPYSSQQQQMLLQHHKMQVVAPPPCITSIEQLLLDERFLGKLFLYFNPYERRTLAQVCTRWRDVLYRSPRFWSGLLPTLQCRELRIVPNHDRVKLYNSLVRRGFHALALVGATDEDALDVVHSFPLASKHIHSLSLRCSSISDRGLEALLDHLQSLFELELAGCNEVTEAGLWACLTPRIVSLSLADCINIADEAVGAVAQLLPSLYEFSLQAYHVTDAALGYFSPKQSHSLSILRLQSCWELTNHGIVNIVHSLPHLTVLSLSGCSKLTDDGVELIAENLQKLRALDLSWCPRITDSSLEYIACDLNQLEELTLDRCVHITDIGVGYISTMLSLTALFLRWCSQVRDFGLQHLCSMRNLQVLSLAGCPLLTSSGLSSLIQLRHLQELELTNCPGASQELFEYLKEHLPRCLIIE
ncbi:F-box/LRR-repeat protein 16 [Episyrphus balteatus]|uniref:F-box/LRR-repeat protein 16 n=1 Tax=Episyrphus balteatus TaxID=286459 RepID=UPI0024854345|nr:F-box/LRR-repeat protein 16 [Episyrphus balteatus]